MESQQPNSVPKVWRPARVIVDGMEGDGFLYVGYCPIYHFTKQRVETVEDIHVTYDQTNMLLYMGHRKFVDVESSGTLEKFKLAMGHRINCRAMRIDMDDTLQHLRPPKEEKKLAKVAACILVRDSEENVLLIRRRSDITLYPSAWVCPGGHVDPDESIETAGMRELEEEAGVTLTEKEGEFFYDGEKVEVDPLVIYETSNPQPDDSIRSQHIIVFFTMKLPKHHRDIPVKLQEEEVDASMWISREKFEQVTIDEDTTGTTEISVLKGGDHYETENHSNDNFKIYARNGEGIGYAHVYALKRYFSGISN